MLSFQKRRFVHLFFGGLVGMAGCLLFSSGVSAGDLCTAQANGIPQGSAICIPPADCAGIDPVTNRQETNVGVLDCSSNGVIICCVSSPLPAQQAAPPAPVTCTSQGGSCMPTCLGGDVQVNGVTCDGPDLVCCKPPGLNAPSSPASSAPKASGGGSGGLLSGVSPKCRESGDCELEDIVQTGVTVATFFMGLAGALFFAIFIYGGAMYLLSFGDAGRVKKGTEAIKGATIGIIIVMCSWTIVRYIATTLARPGYFDGGASGTVNNSCSKKGPEWSCQNLQGKTQQEALADGQSKGLQCQTNLCSGPANVLCCKPK